MSDRAKVPTACRIAALRGQTARRAVLGCTFALTLTAFTAPPALAEGRYGYISAVDGSAALYPHNETTRTAAEINYPLVTGDRLIVDRGGHVELVLPDGNLLRVDGGSELVFPALAATPEDRTGESQIELRAGNLQLVVTNERTIDTPPRVDTVNATVYPRRSGVYRITTDGQAWTEVVAREGATDVVTPSDDVALQAGQMATVEGTEHARIAVANGPGYDRLERWASTLDNRRVDVDTASYVDNSLGVDTRQLYGNGSWVSYGGSYAWRPYVTAGWRPYWNGYWAYTPAGQHWVGYEPWGYVTHHYGTWDYLPSYGWAWFPGYHWSPAWVYWYWGPSYAGWCPTGYYTRWYGDRHHGYGFHDGVYGRAGGRWHGSEHWNFVDVDHFGSRDQRDNVVRGDRLDRLPDGVITTNTAAIGRDVTHGQRAIEQLGTANGRALVNVKPFLDRTAELPRAVSEVALVDVSQARAQGKPFLVADPSTERPATRQPARGDARSGGKPMVVETNGGAPSSAPVTQSADSGGSWRKPVAVGGSAGESGATSSGNSAGATTGGSRSGGKPRAVESNDGVAAVPPVARESSGGNPRAVESNLGAPASAPADNGGSWRTPARGAEPTESADRKPARSPVESDSRPTEGSAAPESRATPSEPARPSQDSGGAREQSPPANSEPATKPARTKPAAEQPASDQPAAEENSAAVHGSTSSTVGPGSTNWRQRELATVVSPSRGTGYPAVRVEADGSRTEVRTGAAVASPSAARSVEAPQRGDWRQRGAEARRIGQTGGTAARTQPAPLTSTPGTSSAGSRREVPVVRRVIEGVRSGSGPGGTTSRYGTGSVPSTRSITPSSRPAPVVGGRATTVGPSRPVTTTPSTSTSSTAPSSSSSSGSSTGSSGSQGRAGSGSSASGSGSRGGSSGGGSSPRGGGSRPHGG